MTLPQLCRVWAVRSPEAVALIEAASGRSATYAQLDAMVARAALVYRGAGVAPGDRVVIALENSIDMVAAYLGAMAAGAIAVPLPGGTRNDRLAVAVADAAPRVCVMDGATAEAAARSRRLAGVPAVFVTDEGKPPTLPEASGAAVMDWRRAEAESSAGGGVAAGASADLAAIIYTSGSTGEPRGVMLTHDNFVQNARSIVSYLGLTQADRVMCVLPFHYVYGLSLLHTHLLVGGSIVLDNRFVFPNVVLSAMREHRVSGFAGVPSTFALLLHRSNLAETSLPELRYVTQAGGAMPTALIRQWIERGPAAPFYVMYGATEAAARLTYLPPGELPRKLGSIGRPIPSVEIQVMTESGALARPGEVGELVARGPNISRGYWHRPEETQERFGPHGYRTGDLGYADDEGFLFVVGRLHDMIKVGAHRVGAKEIEDVLHEHPAVLEAAVVPAPHELLGEVPVAFVALREALGDAETALRAHCASRLATHKVPVRAFVERELPKLAGTGKTDRRALRQRAQGDREAVSR